MFKIKDGLLIALIFTFSVTFALQKGYSISLAIGLVLLITLGLLKFKKGNLKVAIYQALVAIKEAKNVYILVLMIGMNVSMWIASGIVPTLIYYGFSYVEKVPFVPFAFVLSGLLAFFLGTGLGTVSTIGIAFFALGKSAGVPEGILLGAIVSGAYIADRLSPISALVNFALDTAKVSFKEAFKTTVKPLLPAIFLTLALYIFLGSRFEVSVDTLYYKGLIQEAFVVSPALFLIPLMILALSFINLGTVKILLSGIITGAGFALFMQKMSLKAVLSALVFGFDRAFEDPWLNTLNIGGAYPMLEVVFVIAGGIALLSFLEVGGFIDVLKEGLFKRGDTKSVLYAKTGILSIVLDAFTCDQTVGILLPSKHMSTSFEEKGMTRSDLYASIASSGTSLAPLMPWNVNAVIIAAITGVSALSFAPYAFLNWLHFPFALLGVWLLKGKKGV